jgi:hypothetical protein
MDTPVNSDTDEPSVTQPLTPFETLLKEIDDLENERNTMYKRFKEIEVLLDRKNVMRTGFEIIKEDPELQKNLKIELGF